MILLGYAATVGYVLLLIYALGPVVQRRFGLETSRKVIHTMLFMVWVLIDHFFRGSIHQLVIPILFLALNALSYRFHLYGSVEREEDNHPGTVYFAAAITVVMGLSLLDGRLYLPGGAAAFCLTFGDGFAAMVGQRLSSRHLQGRKTLAGFLACFAASAAALLAFRALWWPQLSLAGALALAALSAIMEQTGGGLDNFTITFSVFIAGFLMAEGLLPGLAGALLWAAAVFAVVFITGAITYAGSLAAMAMVVIFRLCGGLPGLMYLLGCYFAIFAVGRIRSRRTGRRGHGRGLAQILINGGAGTALMLLHGVTGQPWLVPAAFAAIGGCFIDSVSSDVGRLSAKQPYDPIRRHHVPAGLSGGMTLLGTAAAAAASLAISLGCLLAGLSPAAAAMTGALSFLQTLVDTALGSLVQAKYRCPRCGEITERPQHCGGGADLISGFAFVTNNAVNLVSSLIITLLCILLLPLCC